MKSMSYSDWLRDWLRDVAWKRSGKSTALLCTLVAEAVKKPGVIVYCVEDTKSLFEKLRSVGFNPKRDGDLLSGSLNGVSWSFVVVPNYGKKLVDTPKQLV